MRNGPVDAIRKLTDAWIRKDVEGMSRWLTEDITELGPSFPGALIGTKSFFRGYADYLSGPLEILSYRIIRPLTMYLSARFALVHFTYRMRTRTQNRVEISRGKESMLVEKSRGRWRVKFIHWHRDPASTSKRLP